MSVESSGNHENIEALSDKHVELKDLSPNSLNKTYSVLDANGSEIGDINLTFFPEKKEAVIANIKLATDMRGKGYGKAVYKKVIEIAKDNGLRLRSSVLISSDASKVWENLEKEGLAELVDGKYYAK